MFSIEVTCQLVALRLLCHLLCHLDYVLLPAVEWRFKSEDMRGRAVVSLLVIIFNFTIHFIFHNE